MIGSTSRIVHSPSQVEVAIALSFDSSQCATKDPRHNLCTRKRSDRSAKQITRSSLCKPNCQTGDSTKAPPRPPPPLSPPPSLLTVGRLTATLCPYQPASSNDDVIAIAFCKFASVRSPVHSTPPPLSTRTAPQTPPFPTRAEFDPIPISVPHSKLVLSSKMLHFLCNFSKRKTPMMMMMVEGKPFVRFQLCRRTN
jgi:hypothetical protein